jgi:hypothetical protein
MITCPYAETIIDESSEEEVSNPLYEAWHKGYEAHKIDTMVFKQKIQEKAFESKV